MSTPAEIWGLHLANVNRVTTKLRSRGLIVAAADETDRRRINFYLTDDGADLFEPAADHGAIRDEFFMSCLTEGERQELDRLITKMTDFIRTAPEPPHD